MRQMWRYGQEAAKQEYGAAAQAGLRYSFVEGAFAAVMAGFTQEFFTPFILLVGASVRQVAMLNALPNVTAAVLQLFIPAIAARLRSRRRMICRFVLTQALLLVPMAAIALSGRNMPGIFIACVVFFTAGGALATPAWGSLMSDLIAADKRGAYFGWRNRTLGFVTVGSMLLGGAFLHGMKRINPFYGFALLFGGACVCRLFSWFLLNKMYEPPLEQKPEHHFTIVQFVRRIRESNFAKFVLFVALMSFSVNLASPFFSVLMLRELQFNYLLFTMITLTATLTMLVTIARWGRHADIVGNLRVIRFTALLIGVVPLLWLVSRHPGYLFFAQVASGFLWAGFNLCTSNFIYDAVMPEKRTRCIAYFNLFNGVALCSGALVGGWMLPLLPATCGHKFLTLCIISGILRGAVGIGMPRLLREVRPVEKMHSDELFFSMVGIRPLLGADRRTIRY
ncbi:MAG: MFS transporter [Candidatus Omnitrophica bacterium]|nr:MFS transporter [Candidatus Omnitrophota bacterium]